MGKWKLTWPTLGHGKATEAIYLMISKEENKGNVSNHVRGDIQSDSTYENPLKWMIHTPAMRLKGKRKVYQ